MFEEQGICGSRSREFQANFLTAPFTVLPPSADRCSATNSTLQSHTARVSLATVLSLHASLPSRRNCCQIYDLLSCVTSGTRSRKHVVRTLGA